MMLHQYFTDEDKADTLSIRLGGEERAEQLCFHILADALSGISDFQHRWRGRSADSNMDRTKADQIGMLATVMNAIYVADAFRQNGIKAFVQTPIMIGTMTEMFSKESAIAHLEKGEVVIFAAGMGHPFFSTDTITALQRLNFFF